MFYAGCIIEDLARQIAAECMVGCQIIAQACEVVSLPEIWCVRWNLRYPAFGKVSQTLNPVKRIL